MFRIQPKKGIIVECIRKEWPPVGNPLYMNSRKIKSQNCNGQFELMHVNECVDKLPHSERICDILPWLQKNYVSVLEDMDDGSPVKRMMRNWGQCGHLITVREATKTWTSPGVLPHCSRKE
ncbi:Pre-mRNA-splicing factor 38A [Galemys pyrenaicus]|uniref:Pre-mRNA-splicing factor 38B n=1 Tax=Galemys pyrenaicus TaxID=202257 RepID=A0A8J6AB61_GALPY|nr:Pre-mRNA-splicing factor 38A [Galemys pyrenaicus]